AMGAVSVVLALTPLGYLPWFGGISLTVMHIPAIVAAVLEGPWSGLAVGLIFGVTSLVRAAVAPIGPLDPLFTNPLVSVLPRLLIGPAAWVVFAAFRGRLRPMAAAAAGAAGSFVNTTLVLSMLGLTAAAQISGLIGVEPGALPTVLAGIAVSNGLPEAAAAAVFTGAVVSAWKGLMGASGRARLAREEEGER
ncbi:MAG TPA: ECF transporter S component, partial [Magnetospirillaceae bacterium]|nr:ECF transporter S component [Magnetospirillaceae bacterium]